MASVKLTNVKKIYGKNTVAVHDFNLYIADKEFVVFVGPSGCGKSTTLRMIAGLEEISEGTVEIGGKVVNDLQPKDRDIAMVFQNYALYPHLTVFENMAFALRLKKIPESERDEILKRIAQREEQEKAEKESAPTQEQPEQENAAGEPALTQEQPEQENAAEESAPTQEQPEQENAAGESAPTQEQPEQESAPTDTGKVRYVKIPERYVKIPEKEIYNRVTEAAEILGITEYLTRRPRELSGGQRQRVAIGRAMVRDSQVFLMDEPLSNLDAKLRNQMRAEIIQLRKKIDTTFVYVTHDQTEAMTLGDRIVVMKDGYIMQVGTPTEVFERPANLFVAEFIGAPKMNTVRTELTVENGKYYVTPYGVKMVVDGDMGEALKGVGAQSQDIILGVRPEHVTLTGKANPSAVPCTVRVTEMMGSELHLHVTAVDGNTLVVRVPTVSLSHEQVKSLRAGARIYVTFKSKVMHFFDAQTEVSLLVAKPENAQPDNMEEK